MRVNMNHFIIFLESLKHNSNFHLINTIQHAYDLVFESDIYYHGTPYSDFDGEYKGNTKWFTQDREIANNYANNPIRHSDKDINKFSPTIRSHKLKFNNPATFGFSSNNTMVPVSEMVNRINDLAVTSFANKSIEQAEEIYAKIEPLLHEFAEKYSGTHHVYDYWDKSTELVKILKLLGYDSIKAIEGGSETYGVFDGNQIELLNESGCK